MSEQVEEESRKIKKEERKEIKRTERGNRAQQTTAKIPN